MDSAVDLAVVGAGLAGLTAACAAREYALSVRLIEATTSLPGAGNTSVSAGTFHANYLDPLLPPGELVESMRRATDGEALTERLVAWAEAIAPAIDWARSRGADLATHPTSGVLQARPVRRGPGLTSAGQGIHRFACVLAERARAAGVHVSTQTRAVDLLSDGGRIAGVVTQDRDGSRAVVPAMNVLLADGGFQANPELVARHVGASNYLLRATTSAKGDGMQMALAAGAAVTGVDRFYGHCLHADARDNTAMWPFPVLDTLAEHGQVLTTEAEDLSLGCRDGVDIANAIAASGGDCWTVVPATTWNTAPFGRGARLCDYLREQSAVTYSGATSHAALVRAIRGKADTGAYAPDFEGYVALPTIAGLTLTMGGIVIDDGARVLDEMGQSIAGLLAAGSTTGGLHGGPHAGYAGGLLEALTGGFVAARTVAASQAV